MSRFIVHAAPLLNFLLPISKLHSLAEGSSIYYSRPLRWEATGASASFTSGSLLVKSLPSSPPPPRVSNLSWIRAVISSMWALCTCERYTSLPFIKAGRCTMPPAPSLAVSHTLSHSLNKWSFSIRRHQYLFQSIKQPAFCWTAPIYPVADYNILKKTLSSWVLPTSFAKYNY